MSSIEFIKISSFEIGALMLASSCMIYTIFRRGISKPHSTIAEATITMTEMSVLLKSCLPVGQTTFFSSLFISRNHFATRLKKPGLVSSFFTAVTALAGAAFVFFSSAIFTRPFRSYLVSTCLVCLRQKGQYLLRSKRSDLFFLFLTVL